MASKFLCGQLEGIAPPQLFGREGDRPHGVGAYDRKSLGVGAKVLGTFVPGSESSRERKFLGAKVLGTFAPGSESSRERKFLGAKVLGTFVPGSESSIPWYFRSRERKFLGAKVLRSESSIIPFTDSTVFT